MAKRRMFSLDVVDTDNFLDMPLSAQALYFHMGMRADDDGFVASPLRIQKITGASNDDLKLLIAKGYVIPFESGIVVITHWKQQNSVKADRYTPTVHIEERNMLNVDDSQAYRMEPKWNQIGTTAEPQYRLVEDRSVKYRTVEESDKYCAEPQRASAPDPVSQDIDFAEVEPLILNDGSEWRPTKRDVEEWERLYSGIDVIRELLRMRQWTLSNPGKRKTRRGARRFCTNWLDIEQNRARPAYSPGSDKYTGRINAVDNW